MLLFFLFLFCFLFFCFVLFCFMCCVVVLYPFFFLLSVSPLYLYLSLGRKSPLCENIK